MCYTDLRKAKMILPIVPYGKSILRQKCKDIDADYPDLQKLIDDMWETLYPAGGTGLAAPQVNHAIKLFVVDSKVMFDKMDKEDQTEFFDGDQGIKETFINAKITEESDEYWTEQEGCLSIPTLAEDVERPWTITIEYLDRDFQKHTQTYSGTTARVIQHEFDHTEGKLYLDYINPLKRQLLKGKLLKISKGEIKGNYPMM